MIADAYTGPDASLFWINTLISNAIWYTRTDAGIICSELIAPVETSQIIMVEDNYINDRIWNFDANWWNKCVMICYNIIE